VPYLQWYLVLGLGLPLLFRLGLVRLALWLVSGIALNKYRCEWHPKVNVCHSRTNHEKLVISVKHPPYEERLKRLNLPTLKYRRLRGDMIGVFKLLNNFYDKEVDFMLPLKPAFSTRGNSYKLQNYSFHYDLRKYSFCPRVTKVWNSLPYFVVNVDTVNVFKAVLLKTVRSRPDIVRRPTPPGAVQRPPHQTGKMPANQAAVRRR